MKLIYLKIIVVLVFCLLSLVTMPVFAAEIFFGVHQKTVGVAEKFEVGVFLDTQHESVNAVEGNITFPSDSFEFQGFYTGNSSLTLWIQQPAVTSPGTVSFSGIIPGGLTSAQGYLFSLILIAKKKGNGTLEAASETILLNDGIGSAAQVTKAPLTITVTDKPSSLPFTPLHDINPPENFEPQISRNPETFNGNWFLTFAAQDKGSGIDRYEVLEKPPFGSFQSLFSKNQWVTAQSPYLLQDQSLQSVVLVKAVDKTGNARMATVSPKNACPWYDNYFIWGIIAIIGSISIVLWKKKHLR